MNEFTKQDLEQLSFAIYTYPHSDDDHLYEELRNKIKYMIDNYCEHKETEIIGGWVSRCVKCGMKFGDETQ